MEPDRWPRDTVADAARVARLISQVDQSSEEDRDMLLFDLLCAVWPTRYAQDQ